MQIQSLIKLSTHSAAKGLPENEYEFNIDFYDEIDPEV